MIEFQDVSFSFDDKALISHVNFTMADGQFVGILGPNGGGKSTFLRLALGLIKPRQGTIVRTDSRIAYLSQTTAVSDANFQCTVEELVGLGLVGRHTLFFTKTEKEKIRQTLETHGLYPLRRRLITQLSGGQLQRVRLAKALIGDPTLIVFDEPDAGMDEQNHHHLVDTLNELHRQGKSILFVSHHPHDLEKADAIYFIEDGEMLTYEEELKRGHHHVSL